MNSETSLLLSLQILLILSTGSRSKPFLTFCGDTNYTAGSAYESNLLSLINELIVSTWNSSFYSTATVGSSPEGQVFGLAQCRPDVSASSCNYCLNSTAIVAPKPNGGCPLSKSAAFRSDYCVLRYSDQRFFSIHEMSLVVSITNPMNASNPDVFNRTINDLMDKISPKASEADSRFEAGSANYSDIRDIYGMAWCTQDLSSSDCLQCLHDMSVRLPVGKVGGQVMTASCITRFETYSFISISPPSPPSPPSQPSPPSSTVAEPPQLAAAPIGHSRNTVKWVLVISLPIAFALALVCILFILRLRNKRVLERQPTSQLEYENIRTTDSLFFDLDTIRKATKDFSEENILGAGGFGPVYKGVLEDGQHIAVKRLSRTSRQGFIEMKNEVALVFKLQHKNLVRLLGCCLEDNEMLLVYEYLPKTSLDKYLFDPTKRPQLDWGIRYKIIQGIGRGLLYLHEDSRLKIIHRDLKASNILLDNRMTPKISDFGIARLFHNDQTQQNTSRIAGTYGYMAPEYAMHGLFSSKSDVFSYGVLILEIITGRRNGVFTDGGHELDLLSYIWKNWNQGTALQVVDQCLGLEYQSQQVLKCLHIGLISVQDDALLRPSMAEVIVMMSSDSTMIPAPLMPAFYVGNNDNGNGNFESSAREAEEIVSQNQP